ncbi:MAG: PspA/IM30 family protein [Anaerolineae bacterium]|nr:PspA/IM30 family protein [Anaerolineae bacterium]
MAQGILEKINTLISANLHAMVDSALQANSLAVMDEYLRRAQKDLENLEDATVTIGGSVKTLKRKYDEITAAVEKLDRDIDTLLTRGKNDLAVAAQSDLNSKQQLAQEYYEQWQSQQTEYQRMLDSKVKLEAKLVTTKQEREHLKELLKLAEAKATTTKAIKSLKDAAGTGDQEIASIADAIRARLDREDAELEMSSARLSDQMEEVLETSAIDAQLEERRKRLGLGADAAGGAGSSSSASSSSSSN